MAPPFSFEVRASVQKQDGRHSGQKEKQAETRKIQMGFEKINIAQVQSLLYEITK